MANPQETTSSNTQINPIVNQSILSDLEISLHPLPILNISDHFTRTQLQSSTNSPSIYGALLGTQLGKKIEIVNCFEILVDQDTKIDCGFLKTRREQFQQVFPTLDLLGWYTNGPEPKVEDFSIQNQLTESTDLSTPIVFFYNPSSTIQNESIMTKVLPIQIYEFTQSTTTTDRDSFVKCTFDIQTGEAERIAVEYITKPDVGSKESGLIANLISQRNAIEMLHHKLGSIVEYLKQVTSSLDCEQSKMEIDLDLLREISSLVASLPNPDENPSFKNEYITESIDALLTSYLSSQSKALSETNQLMDRYMYLNIKENVQSSASSSKFSNSSNFHHHHHHHGNSNKPSRVQKQ